MFPSRLVALVDELQERRLVTRVENARDRRTYSLVLTAEGRELLERIGRVAREHQESLLTSLSAEERDHLAVLLRRIADQQGLQPGVHPGFARLRPQGKSKSSAPKSKEEI
jgi:DNA-binding MarR family transcriptional regulator